MEIKILKKVAANPIVDGFKNRGMSLQEIAKLEQLYNHGRAFPQCLREYLYLAGEFSN
ncbi:MAG: hypothetical protein RL660_2688, partial [Bacteroidota bacterium]